MSPALDSVAIFLALEPHSACPLPSPHSLRASLIGLFAFAHSPRIICSLFISCAGLVSFGHHPGETGSVLSCMFFPPKILESILELEQDPCRGLGSQLYVIKSLIWPWVLGYPSVPLLGWAACSCCVKQNPEPHRP